MVEVEYWLASQVEFLPLIQEMFLVFGADFDQHLKTIKYAYIEHKLALRC